MKVVFKSRIYSLIMAGLLIIAVVSVTYAWIESDISPEINSTMKIASSPGLLMSFENSDIADVIDINKFIMDENSSFVLSEASSADGTFENLFIRFSKEPYDEIFLRKATSTDANQSFIYFMFSITATDADRDVWFDESSVISLITKSNNEKALNVIRVSMTLYQEDGNPFKASNGCQTTIFGTREEKEDNYVTWAIADIDRESQQVVDRNQFPLYYARQNVHLFSEYSSQSDCFLTLKKNEIVKVNFLVWLEGTDPDCDDFPNEPAVSGSELGLIIKFNSEVHSTP